jgi:hypothetical protein
VKLLELLFIRNLVNTRKKETSLTAVNSLIRNVEELLVKENATLSPPKKFQQNAHGTNFQKDAKEEVVVMFMKSAPKVLVQQKKDAISLEQSFVKNLKRLVSTRKFHQLVNNWNVARKLTNAKTTNVNSFNLVVNLSEMLNAQQDTEVANLFKDPNMLNK